MLEKGKIALTSGAKRNELPQHGFPALSLQHVVIYYIKTQLHSLLRLPCSISFLHHLWLDRTAAKWNQILHVLYFKWVTSSYSWSPIYSWWALRGGFWSSRAPTFIAWSPEQRKSSNIEPHPFYASNVEFRCEAEGELAVKRKKVLSIEKANIFSRCVRSKLQSFFFKKCWIQTTFTFITKCFLVCVT